MDTVSNEHTARPRWAAALRRLRSPLAASVLLAGVLWALLASQVRISELSTGERLKRYAQLDNFEPEGRSTARMFLQKDLRLDNERVLRAGNPEWSLLYRLFLALVHANIAVARETERGVPRSLAQLDAIVDDTLALERAHGQEHFLLPYVKRGAYVVGPGRSAFVDGEIALMVAARQLAARALRAEQALRDSETVGRMGGRLTLPDERVDLTDELRARLGSLAERMRQSPVLCAESYPDECWTFCTLVTLCAMRALDVLDGSDAHRPLIVGWLALARTKLMDRETGLLISSFSQRGVRGDGPEGSTLWFAAHMLQVLDPTFAAQQYQRAKDALGISLFGLGFAREWPSGQGGAADIDVGTFVPWLEAGAASSGFAVLGARFGDRAYLHDLNTSISLFGQPSEEGGGLHFAAAGPMGNAVLLYALTQGPLWAYLAGGRS